MSERPKSPASGDFACRCGSRRVLAGLKEIAETGRDPQRGGYSRHLWQAAGIDLVEWFTERATRLGLDVTPDRNGNLWAWWGAPGVNAVVTGSHLDSVPGGGAFDGPLGVVSALDAIARLMATGFTPSRPCAVLVLAEEEGSRFGVACLGSRLLTGAIKAGDALALTDRDGVTFAEAATAVGFDASHVGRDDEALGRIGLFIELHVEQGRGLIDVGQPLAIASSILAHGRWRLTFSGEGNHAGSTHMTGRRDPMVAAARAISAVQAAAFASPGSRATVGRLVAIPGGTNVIASQVTAWLDARAETDEQTRALVADIEARIYSELDISGCLALITEESYAGAVAFDPVLIESFRTVLGGASGPGNAAGLGGIPLLVSGAGHDAGVLAAAVPSALLFVRNPTGVSHSPEEFAELADCRAGVVALEKLLRSVL